MKTDKPKWGLQSLRHLLSWRHGGTPQHQEWLYSDLPCPWWATRVQGASTGAGARHAASLPGEVAPENYSKCLPGRAFLGVFLFHLSKLQPPLQKGLPGLRRKGGHPQVPPVLQLPCDPVNCDTRGRCWTRARCIYVPWSAWILRWQAWFIWMFLFFSQEILFDRMEKA